MKPWDQTPTSPLLGPPLDTEGLRVLALCRALIDNWEQAAEETSQTETGALVVGPIAPVLRLCANQLRDAIGDPRK